MDPTVTELLHDFPDLTPHLYGVHANVVVGRNLAISVASKPQMMSFSTHSCTAWGRWAAWHTGTFYQNYVHFTMYSPLEVAGFYKRDMRSLKLYHFPSFFSTVFQAKVKFRYYEKATKSPTCFD